MDSKGKKVILFVFGVLFVLEITLRMMEPYISLDLKHYRDIPSIINNVAKAHNTKILFMGNSLTRRGIDRNELKAAFPNATIGLVYPDDTFATDWYWIYKNQVEHRIPNLDYLFILFAPANLYDWRHKRTTVLIRMARFAHTTQLKTIITREHLDFNQSLQLVLAHFLDLFALKERIQRRILNIIPNYSKTIRKINELHKAQLNRHMSNNKKHRMKDIIELIRSATSHKTTVIMIAAPLVHKYKVPTRLVKFIKRTPHAFLVDANRMDNIDASDFRADQYHLNDKGAHKLTRFVLDEFFKLQTGKKQMGQLRRQSHNN